MTSDTTAVVDSLATASPPPVARFSHLRPRDSIGFAYLLLALFLTVLALYLSTFQAVAAWLAGQVLLSLAMLQWFAMVHEAGHKTLFRSSHWNALAGHVAGYFAIFPFANWKLVHALHHRWTGWQDLDATTAALAPRRVAWWERLAVNVCWWLWLPLFSILYRLDNYWNLPRIYRLLGHKRIHARVTINVMVLLALYALTVGVVGGPERFLRLVGLGTILSLMMQDPLILSQHTHVPMRQSDGRKVDPIPPLEQELFTRSLKFPTWFSRFILLNMDAHELHHMYSSVPGYHLDRIDYRPHNEMPWWRWLLRSKRIRGDVLLFQNRNQTGFDI